MPYAPMRLQVQNLQTYASAHGLDWEIAFDIANEGEPPAFQLVAQNGLTEKKMSVIGETFDQATATISLAAHAGRASLRPDPRYKVVMMGQRDGFGWKKRNPDEEVATTAVVKRHFEMSNKTLIEKDRNLGTVAFKLYRMAFDHGALLAK